MKQRFPNMKKRCLLWTMLWRRRQSVFRSRCHDSSTPNSVSLSYGNRAVSPTDSLKVPVEFRAKALNGPASGHEIDDKDNQRDHQDQMNQIAGHETAEK
jgi:hypothetical protein